MPAIGKKMSVYSVIEKKHGTVWTRLGNAFVNRDDSITVWLDAYPADGKLHLREKPNVRAEKSREEQNDAIADAEVAAAVEAEQPAGPLQ